jgi:hypothetical protein
MKRTVEILFSDRCPYVKLAIQRVLTILRRRSPEHDVELRLVHVENLADAMRHRFPGSPTIRVDGHDVGGDLVVSCFGLRGRAYAVDGRVEWAPPESWIARALGMDEGFSRRVTPAISAPDA